ncbi:hypothetical protein VN12_08335 [Pirellula sp. SH-Sr6A]|uniref:hypothetical protein n=1 Tax=Pirellula sp. SH-Sr6A TaxID=1632865 RepID=UPI00078B87AA|nr:hypothetical protein [Pirellula sp. SH-Sr6A]AMV32116.1 hypothetical protein VN12_08335 [Pirellula sp. SH-Sr6A]
MSETRIRAGTRLLFTPIPRDFMESTRLAIGKVCEEIASIADAYLVRCSLPKEAKVRLVLVLVVPNRAEHASVAKRLIDWLSDVTWEEAMIDVLPVVEGAIPPAVLQVGTRVKGA